MFVSAKRGRALMAAALSAVLPAAVLAAFGSLSADTPSPMPTVATISEFEPCVLQGASRVAECATVTVPLNYAAPDGRKIELRLALLPATGGASLPDPIVVLAGGPGQAASEVVNLAETVFRFSSKRRDIVMLDVRGTGHSTPLDCEMPDEAIAWEEDAWVEFFAACRAKYDFDVRYINLETITQDLEQVRQLMGYPEVNLWGGSYGTRKAAHYVRRFGEHVRSAVVDAMLPPDVSLFESVPASTERALQKLLDDCHAQPSCIEAYPDTRAEFMSLMAKAEAGDLYFDSKHPVRGVPIHVKIDGPSLVESVRSVMYGADGTTRLPFVIHEAVEGNLTPLMMSNFGSTAPHSGMYIGMSMSVLCGEEVARISDEQAQLAGQGSFARDTYYEVWSEFCRNWDYFTTADGLPSDLYEPVQSDVPLLALSGDLDPITPPELGEIYVQGYPNSKHIIVSGTGHISSYVGCMPSLISKFIDTLDPANLDDSCLQHFKRLPIITGVNGQVD